MAPQPNILLVEDSDDDADLTVRALRRNNVANQIVRLVDGVEAVEYLSATGAHEGRDLSDVPELILLDLKLPRRSGLEVLEWLKADPRYREIPVVVLTSSIEHRDLERAYALGVNSYVQKPWTSATSPPASPTSACTGCWSTGPLPASPPDGAAELEPVDRWRATSTPCRPAHDRSSSRSSPGCS